jgi:hypothetical protein
MSERDFERINKAKERRERKKRREERRQKRKKGKRGNEEGITSRVLSFLEGESLRNVHRKKEVLQLPIPRGDETKSVSRKLHSKMLKKRTRTRTRTSNPSCSRVAAKRN